MAVQQTQALPPQYVEDLQKDYGTQLTATTATPLTVFLNLVVDLLHIVVGVLVFVVQPLYFSPFLKRSS